MSRTDNGHTSHWHTARMREKEVLIIAYIGEKKDGERLVLKDIGLQLGIRPRDVSNIISRLYRMKLIDVYLKHTAKGEQRWIVTRPDKPAPCLGGCGKYLSFTGFCSIACAKHSYL